MKKKIYKCKTRIDKGYMVIKLPKEFIKAGWKKGDRLDIDLRKLATERKIIVKNLDIKKKVVKHREPRQERVIPPMQDGCGRIIRFDKPW